MEEYPEFIRALGQTILDSSSQQPTNTEIADGLVTIVENYRDKIQENQQTVLEETQLVDENEIDLEQTSDIIIQHILMEMSMSVVVLDVLDFICENAETINRDTVIDHLPDRYIKAETTV